MSFSRSLHGTFGEDGTVQGLLELAGLALRRPGRARVVGCDGQGSDEAALRAGRSCRWSNTSWSSRAPSMPACSRTRFGYPMFVKPANLGSSVGISKAKNRDELGSAIADAAQYDRKVIVERAIVGQEIECSVLGNDEPAGFHPVRDSALARSSTITKTSTCSTRRSSACPPTVRAEQIAELRRLAVACYKAVGCEGMARVDFLLEAATGQTLHQRDKHNSGLYVHQHVPQDVGA